MDHRSLPISRSLAVGASFLYVTTFVGPLYAIKRTRIGHESARDEEGRLYTRDHPSVVKARLVTTALSMPICAIGVWAIARRGGFFSSSTSTNKQIYDTLRLVGLRLPESLGYAMRLVVFPSVLTLTLYAGHLYGAYLDSSLPGMRFFDWRETKRKLFTWHGVRNYIHVRQWSQYALSINPSHERAQAPICEEFVFRACIIASGAMAGQKALQLILISPLYFGLAHIHHAYEVYIGGGKTRQALKRGIVQTALQFSYTYLLGVYSSFWFLRSSSIIPPIIVHAVCNVLGLPRPDDTARRHPRRKTAILAAYVGGVVAVSQMCVPLTLPSLFGTMAGSPYSFAFF